MAGLLFGIMSGLLVGIFGEAHLFSHGLEGFVVLGLGDGFMGQHGGQQVLLAEVELVVGIGCIIRRHSFRILRNQREWGQIRGRPGVG